MYKTERFGTSLRCLVVVRGLIAGIVSQTFDDVVIVDWLLHHLLPLSPHLQHCGEGIQHAHLKNLEITRAENIFQHLPRPGSPGIVCTMRGRPRSCRPPHCSGPAACRAGPPTAAPSGCAGPAGRWWSGGPAGPASSRTAPGPLSTRSLPVARLVSQ